MKKAPAVEPPSSLGSLRWNRQRWDNPEEWELYGDNWTFHAEFCNQPYDTWKQAVVDTFLNPFLGADVDVLEIAPGHGRWTEFIVGRSQSLTLVDLNESCIDVCRQRFGSHPEISFITNDGRSLPVADASMDLIWSFGSFVHIDPQDVEAYLAEFRRVLRPGGRFVVHHAGWPEWSCPLIARHIAKGEWRPFGGRVPMSAEGFASIATHHDLSVDEQVRTWGEVNEFGLAFNDVVTIGSLRP